MKLNSIVGLNIMRVRKARGLTQVDLEARCGVTQQYLSGLEAGRRNLSLATLERIALALDVEPADLLDRRLAEEADARSVASSTRRIGLD